MAIFVAGATGQTGRHVVTQLVEQNIPVKALVRDLEKAREMLPATAELVVGDVLEPATFDRHLEGCSGLICATGASPSFDPTGPYKIDYEGTKNLVDCAKAHNIEHFILVSSLCVSKFFHPLNLFWLVLYWKKQAESYIQASGVPYTIVRPGGLKNEDNSEPIVMKGADTLFDGSIPRLKVAKVCVEALSQPAAKSTIVEIVTDPEAQPQSWEQLFGNVAA